MRLIDADAVVQMYEELKDRYKDGICCEVLDSIIKDINNAPTIEPSEQYKKGFEDAKRAFELEYARESENMRKRNAELEVMLNSYRKDSAEPKIRVCPVCGFVGYVESEAEECD